MSFLKKLPILHHPKNEETLRSQKLFNTGSFMNATLVWLMYPKVGHPIAQVKQICMCKKIRE